MSTKEKLIKARVGMLALAEELKNIVSVKPGTSGSPMRRGDKLRSWDMNEFSGVNVTAIPQSEHK